MTNEVEDPAPARVDRDIEHRAALLFVRMWAVAHILHLLIADRNALDTPWNVAVVALAVAVLLRSHSGRLFAALLVAQLVEYAVEMPFSPDHWALVALVNLAILLTMSVKRSTGLDAREASFPAVRILLLIAYGAAALSKWNTAFLDPLTSCANAIAKVVSFGAVGPLGDSHLLNIGATVTESMIFMLLVMPATRCWGVILGLAFHFSLSASPIMVVGDFTATVYALFFLFLRSDVTDRVLNRTAAWAARSHVVRDAGRRPTLTAAIGFIVLGFGGYVSISAALATLYVLQQFYLGTLLLATVVAIKGVRGGARLGRLRLFHVPVLMLAILWSLNPYLGLRTTGSFTMFSNLRTESPNPNHVFMPTWRLTDWQDDMVVLESSNDEELSAGARNKMALPLVALRRMAMDDPSLQVTGRLNGRSVTWGPDDGQVALEPLPQWQYKLFLFRPVTTDGRPYCSQS